MLAVKNGGVWKEPIGDYVKVAGVWTPIKQQYVKVAGVWTEIKKLNFFQRLDLLGLTTNLKLCLDPGATGSYPGSGQVFNDISGGGLVFNVGQTSAAEASDPTFTGTANGRSSEYFSSDGADYFRMSTATPAWMQNLHKDGVLATYIMWGWAPASGALVAFGTGSTAFAQIGVLVGLGSGGGMTYLVNRANAAAGNFTTGPTFTRSVWGMYSFSINENGGATASFMGINSTYTAFNAAVTSPSVSNASYTPEVMAGGNAASIAGSGSRLGALAIYEGVALTQAQVTSIFEATRARYGV
ncbi:hypothetical protein NKI96_10855 [Mesorhizobium sp. M0292]|uniref:hypothetical protein n=1 Tax=Mesorhizobium sp. M0292 TaxID=2956929 RepID=UPI003335F773